MDRTWRETIGNAVESVSRRVDDDLRAFRVAGVVSVVVGVGLVARPLFRRLTREELSALPVGHRALGKVASIHVHNGRIRVNARHSTPLRYAGEHLVGSYGNVGTIPHSALDDDDDDDGDPTTATLLPLAVGDVSPIVDALPAGFVDEFVGTGGRNVRFVLKDDRTFDVLYRPHVLRTRLATTLTNEGVVSVDDPFSTRAGRKLLCVERAARNDRRGAWADSPTRERREEHLSTVLSGLPLSTRLVLRWFWGGITVNDV